MVAYSITSGNGEASAGPELPASVSTDMLLNRGWLSSEHSGYTPLIPGSGLYVRFNTCQPVGSTDGDNIYFPYSLVLHESGHTVGLSGYNIIDVGRKRFYEMSHTTTIPDAVLNYDCRVQKNLDPDTGVQIRHEPDCSPTPFERMVLRTLYHTVN